MIKHILSDGRTLDSVEGLKVPYNQITESAYRLLEEALRRGEQHEQQNRKKCTAAI